MSPMKQAIIDYVNTGADLLDSLKNDIQKDGAITNKTVLALNAFIIAYNAFSELTGRLPSDDDDNGNESDPKLN